LPEKNKLKKTVNIAGIPIDNLSYEEVLSRIGDFVKEKRKVYIVTANPEMILNSVRDEEFSDILKSAELRTADGTGILWAASYLSKPKRKRKVAHCFQLYSSLFCIFFCPKSNRKVLKERVTGADLLGKVVDKSQQKKWKIFLLGAEEGVAKRAARKFSKLYPEANITGCYSGSPSAEDEKEICAIVNEAKPDILFVAYGSPHQEFWIHRNLFKLNTVKVAIGVGGAFDFYGGKIKRAPQWMQKVGLEWLWRLLKEPKRISRIWEATYVFAKLVSQEKRK